MKYSYINVDFKDELKEIKTKLSNMGARSVNVRKGYSGEYEISFSIKCVDAKAEIEEIIKSAGAKNVSARETYGGAKFEYNLDDKVNEREIKKLIQDMLRRKNYHSF